MLHDPGIPVVDTVELRIFWDLAWFITDEVVNSNLIMELDSGMKEYLRSLQASIESQESTIESLRAKNKTLEEKLRHAETQVIDMTEEIKELKEKVQSSTTSITDEITKAAHEVVNEQFLKSLAYEETSGLYYDYKTGTTYY